MKRKLDQQYLNQTKETLNKDYKKRQRRTLDYDKLINPTRRYNNVNIYAPNIGAPKCIKQILTDIEGETDSNTIIGGDFNTPLHQQIDHPERKSIGKH